MYKQNIPLEFSLHFKPKQNKHPQNSDAKLILHNLLSALQQNNYINIVSIILDNDQIWKQNQIPKDDPIIKEIVKLMMILLSQDQDPLLTQSIWSFFGNLSISKGIFPKSLYQNGFFQLFFKHLNFTDIQTELIFLTLNNVIDSSQQIRDFFLANFKLNDIYFQCFHLPFEKLLILSSKLIYICLKFPIDDQQFGILYSFVLHLCRSKNPKENLFLCSSIEIISRSYLFYEQHDQEEIEAYLNYCLTCSNRKILFSTFRAWEHILSMKHETASLNFLPVFSSLKVQNQLIVMDAIDFIFFIFENAFHFFTIDLAKAFLSIFCEIYFNAKNQTKQSLFRLFVIIIHYDQQLFDYLEVPFVFMVFEDFLEIDDEQMIIFSFKFFLNFQQYLLMKYGEFCVNMEIADLLNTFSHHENQEISALSAILHSSISRIIE